LPAVSAPIAATPALRHDPLQAHLASLGEHERSIGYQGVTEQNAVDDADEPQQRVSPFLERALTEALAVEMSVRAKRDRVAIDQSAFGSLQTASATFGNLSVKFVPWRLQRVMGGEMKQFYMVMGEFDFVGICEANPTMSKS
jgi:hypothetical protein